MRYVGGKKRIVSWVREHLVSVRGGRSRYVEPFLGSGAVAEEMAPMFQSHSLSDSHPDLILMWNALVDGWTPPSRVTREEYQDLKKSAPSALRGIVGFGQSFQGKFFGGYADAVWNSHHEKWERPYLEAAYLSAGRVADVLRACSARPVCLDYQAVEVTEDDLVYLDPPYRDTQGYGSKFDSDKFWERAGAWADLGAAVVVSEETAPDGWAILSERTRKANLPVVKKAEKPIRREVLWVRSK